MARAVHAEFAPVVSGKRAVKQPEVTAAGQGLQDVGTARAYRPMRARAGIPGDRFSLSRVRNPTRMYFARSRRQSLNRQHLQPDPGDRDCPLYSPPANCPVLREPGSGNACVAFSDPRRGVRKLYAFVWQIRYQQGLGFSRGWLFRGAEGILIRNFRCS